MRRTQKEQSPKGASSVLQLPPSAGALPQDASTEPAQLLNPPGIWDVPLKHKGRDGGTLGKLSTL